MNKNDEEAVPAGDGELTECPARGQLSWDSWAC